MAQGGPDETSPWSYDPSFPAWHSTPVKNNLGALPSDVSKVSVRSTDEMDGTFRKLARSVPPSHIDIHRHSKLQHTQLPVVPDLESSTVQRQRVELRLLITELKDRDTELNTMAAAHHKQLQAWEQDRQRALGLEKSWARSEAELQKCVEVIRALTRRVRLVEARETELQTKVSISQQQLQKLRQEHQDTEKSSQDLQDQNVSLSSTVLALSSQLGSLQVREEALRSTLQLKDKDAHEAAASTVDLRGRLQDLEVSLQECRLRETRLLREADEARRRCREHRRENSELREELRQHVTQSSAQREEVIRLKQEHQMLCRDLALSGEGDSWKDELLALARSKQERTESELHHLRQVCDHQQNDLKLLQVNLETARHAVGGRSRLPSVGSPDDSLTSLLRRRGCLGSNAKQLALADEDPELLCHAAKDGSHLLVSCCLQRALNDFEPSGLDQSVLKHQGSSKNRTAPVSLNLSDSVSSEASACPTCLKSSPQSRSSADQVTETPPK